MENYKSWIKKSLLIAGLVEIAAGLSHFGMPYFAYQTEGFSFLHQDGLNFTTLCIFAVGILLIAFGSLTILLSLKAEATSEVLHYYTLIKSFLWSARIILEIMYPVNIPLFFIKQPVIVVMPLLFFEWCLFVLAFVMIVVIRKNLSNMTNSADV